MIICKDRLNKDDETNVIVDNLIRSEHGTVATHPTLSYEKAYYEKNTYPDDKIEAIKQTNTSFFNYLSSEDSYWRLMDNLYIDEKKYLLNIMNRTDVYDYLNEHTELYEILQNILGEAISNLPDQYDATLHVVDDPTCDHKDLILIFYLNDNVGIDPDDFADDLFCKEFDNIAKSNASFTIFGNYAKERTI